MEKTNTLEILNNLNDTFRMFSTRTIKMAHVHEREDLAEKVTKMTYATEFLVAETNDDISIIDAYIDFLSSCADTMEALGEKEHESMRLLIDDCKDLREVTFRVCKLDERLHLS
jgi:type II restriction/modification system DNA methylase subunit YeeA